MKTETNTKIYTIIHGNVIYKVECDKYTSNDTHRRFYIKDEIILSIPLSSVLVKDGEGITAQIINGLMTGTGVDNLKTIPNEVNKNIIQSEDNFAEGMIIGGIIGTVLF